MLVTRGFGATTHDPPSHGPHGVYGSAHSVPRHGPHGVYGGDGFGLSNMPWGLLALGAAGVLVVALSRKGRR
jgi:hypothetical protein